MVDDEASGGCPRAFAKTMHHALIGGGLLEHSVQHEGGESCRTLPGQPDLLLSA